ncbi:hypothetical protein POTOM_044893 [Populus tomentosa]|uniref:U1-type domain-containing protein n=1 Tax=Populus tomentosa TaxID=118781 RepID=A0A8X7YIV0_POPTO|nr:hypothetical protein POTOM_044893 [Populus tomentosa]
MENNNAGGSVDNTFRRKFDPEEYLERAREREKQEGKSKSKGPPVQRKPLKHRDYEVDLDSRLGKTQVLLLWPTPIVKPVNEGEMNQRDSVNRGLAPFEGVLLFSIVMLLFYLGWFHGSRVVTPIAPLSQQAGYYCSVCECVVKDSANYLDHINGKKHQRALGMSMRVERASLQQVQERFEKLKKRREPGSFTEQDLDERILKQQEEEEERKRQRRERKKEKKVSVTRILC